MTEPPTADELVRALEALGRTRAPDHLNRAERDAYCYALGGGAGLLLGMIAELKRDTP